MVSVQRASEREIESLPRKSYCSRPRCIALTQALMSDFVCFELQCPRDGPFRSAQCSRALNYIGQRFLLCNYERLIGGVFFVALSR